MGVKSYAKNFIGGANKVGNTATTANITQFELTKSLLKNLSKLTLSPTAKLVLLTLSTYYNPNKPAYPKQDTIGKELGISIASVKRAIKELSEQSFILIECKYSNYYQFTSKIFEIINLTLSTNQKDTDLSIKKIPHDKTINKNNKKHLNNNFSTFNKPVNEIKYLSAYQTRQNIEKSFKIDRGCPLDYSKNEAVTWYESLPEILKNSFFAKEVKKKWNL